MRPDVRHTLTGVARRGALVAGVLACVGQAGCDAGDPLEAIRQRQSSGDVQGTLEPLRELLAERPDDAELHYLYGQTLVQTGQPSLSSWSMRKAMRDPEWLIPAGLQLAQLRFSGRGFGEAIEITSQILEGDPDNVPARLLRARARMQAAKKDPEGALADTDWVLELDPAFLAAYEPRMQALMALDRKPEAREALAEAGRRLTEGGADPAALAWHCTATARFEQDEDPEGAREAWDACAEAYPADATVVTGAMSVHDAAGNPDRALEIVRAAVEKAPGSRSFRTTLANRLVLIGEAAEAEALLREATDSPQPQLAAAAWSDLSKLRAGLGDYGAAAEALEKALELARQAGVPPPQLEFDYADVLVVAGALGRALEVAEELSVPAHRHLIRARVAQEGRQPARALEEFEAGLRLWPDNAYARYYAAYAAMELGNFDRALEEFRYSVRSDAGATDARVVGAELLFAEGRPRQALLLLLAGTGRGDPLAEPEGQLLLMRLYGSLGDLKSVSVRLARLQQMRPGRVGPALAAAAEGAALRAGPAVAAQVLAEAPTADYALPRFAPALRAFVRFGHQAGDPAAAQAELKKALAAHPDAGVFQEIRALDLELSGAPAEAVLGAYTRALELEPRNAGALEAMGRLSLDADPSAALDFFDRAAAADPTNPSPKLLAARALVASGRPAEAAERLDALLLAHPFEAEAALERAQLDLADGGLTPRTLERARRAVRFGGGAEALELLSSIHTERGETALAARAAEGAQALRRPAPAQGQPAAGEAEPAAIEEGAQPIEQGAQPEGAEPASVEG